MTNKEGSDTIQQICPTCGKPLARGRRAGSLTAYLFGASDCNCLRGGDAPKAAKPYSRDQAARDSDFCPKCGLQIAADARDGSLTGFLFQSTRCTCPPDKAFADGEMSARFWKLKEAGSGTIFVSAATEASRATTGSIDLAPGAIIGGVYKIIELIGRGGMGEVYLARHETLGKKCALKVIPPEQVTEIGWQRFQLEAKAVAKLDHINLVRVTDLGIHEGCLPFYAMDYVDGKNLAELLVEQGPMPLKTMLEIFMQVCDGVECAHHGGLLHRDLKPANIMMVTSKTGVMQAKVLDFGLAKLTGHDRTKQSLTAVGDVFGSPFYMSPEQCIGDKLDNRSDIYSLGCTMFECLTGRPPFAGHLASAVIFGHLEADPPSLETIVGPGRFPASMEVVIAKNLRKNPFERYQTLGQLKADLELVAEGKDVQPVYVSRDKTSVRVKSEDLAIVEPPARQWNTPPLALGSLALLIVSIAACFFVRTVEKSRPRAVAKLETVVAHAEPSPQYFKLSKWQGPKPNIAPAGSHFVADGKGGFLLMEPTSAPTIVKPEPPQPWDGKPFLRDTFVSRGVKYKHFVFPVEKVNPNYFQYGRWPHVGQRPVSGDQYFPESEPLCFVPAREIESQSTMLKGLTDGAFDELDLTDRSPDEVSRAVPALSKIKSIRAIRIGGSFLPQGQYPQACDQQVESINQLPNLERLIAFIPFSADSFAKIKRLKSMEEIRLQGPQTDLNSCLRLVKGSRNLQSFAASDWNISPNDLSILTTCPKLHRILVGKLTGSNQELALLAKVPNLTLLEMPDLTYRADLAASLKKFKSLQELRFAKAAWTKEQYGQLVVELPNVKLLLFRNSEMLKNALSQP